MITNVLISTVQQSDSVTNTHTYTHTYIYVYMGFPGDSDVKEFACNARKPGFDSWVGKVPWRTSWQPTPVFLPGESPWTEDPGGLLAKSQT